MFDFLKDNDKGEVNEIKLNKLRAFSENLFSPYEGHRFEELVRSVLEHGVITPIVVRELGDEYEILSGLNRVNACREAGLDSVPAYNVGVISDGEARFIVTESNVMQRGFMELKVSERARCMAVRYEALNMQGYRKDVIEEMELLFIDDGKYVIPLDRVEVKDEYNLSPRSIRRYVRIDKMIDGLKGIVDEGRIGINAAVNLSYLKMENQEVVLEVLTANEVKVSNVQALIIREMESKGKFSLKGLVSILVEPEKKENKRFKLSQDFMDKYFDGVAQDKIQEVLEEAMEMWLRSQGLIENKEQAG